MRQRLRAITSSSLYVLSVSRIKVFFREPGALFWTFVFPMLITIALGMAFRKESGPRIGIAVTRGVHAAAVASALERDPAVEVQVLAPSEAEARLRAGEILLAVDVPDADGAPIVYRFDALRPDATTARQLVDARLQRQAGRVDALRTRDEVETGSGARYVDWLVPGLLGMQLLNGALWGSAWSIVSARQRSLLKRLAATPMRRSHFLLSFQIAGLLFVPMQVLTLFVFARFTFGVVVHGSPLALFVLAFVGAWSFAGLGLLCASRARNTETLNGLVNLVTIPMLLLSGVFFSSSRFPAVVRPVIRFLPLSALNEAVRNVVNDGASIFAQQAPLTVLVAWGLLSSVAALRLFRWT